MSLTAVMWITVLLPLAGAAGSFLAEVPRRAAYVCLVFTGAASVMAVAVVAIYVAHPHSPAESAITFWTFTPSYSGTPGNPADTLPGGTITDFHAQIGIVVDGLSAVLAATIAVISFIVQLHSLGYMRATVGFHRHFWLVSLLTFAAMGTAVSANLFTFLLLWGLISVLASFIAGHWSVHPDGAVAGRRTAIWHHIGDLALLMAVVVTFVKLAPFIDGQPPPADHEISDPFNFGILNATWHRVHTGGVGGAGTRTLVVIAVLILISAMFRAALLPFNTWLLSTLDGPTPSVGFMQAIAVTGGGAVLIARVYPLFVETPHMLSVLALAGAVAAVGGALLALVETDVLRLVSAAMVSHLGLVFVALGTGGFAAGMFHLYAHAWFGAALFLCVANLVVAYKTRVLAEIGGAWKQMPSTSLALLVASVSAAGVVLGGFWSTRGVLAAALNDTSYAGSAAGRAVQDVVVAAVVLTIVLGAAYPLRLLLCVTRNQPAPRRGFSLPRVRETERITRTAAWALAVLAAVCGLIGIPGITRTFGHYVTVPLAGAQGRAPLSIAAFVIVALAVAAGLLLGVALSGPAGASGVVRRLASPVLAVADMQAALDHVTAFAALRSAAQLRHVDRFLERGLLPTAGDAVELTADAAGGHRSVRLASMLAVGTAITVAATAALMLAVTGHLPLVGAPR